MFIRPTLRTFAATAAVAALALSACGQAPDEHTAQTVASEEMSAEATAEFATVDAGLVHGLVPTVYVDDSRNVRAEVPVIATARQMTSAMEVLRERGLREAAWDKATKVTVDYRVVASGPGTLGIVVTPVWTGSSGQVSRPALVWYDASTKRVFSSPVLIREDQWAAFKAEVVKAAGKGKNKKVDKERLGRALDADAAPQGDGPMLGFDAKGDMVVRFAAGAVADDAVTVRVAGAAVEPLLSDFGQRAAAAGRKPSAFDGTPAPGTETTAGSSAQATPGARSATPRGAGSPAATSPAGTSPAARATPATSAAAGGGRPSTAVGPDCSRVTCVALTYDDGPGADTPKVLQALLEAKAPATFFQLGQMIQANPSIAKQVASDGNEVGSHSVSHPDLAKVGPERLTKEIAGNADIMEKAYGRRPMILRPPYGSHNANVDRVVRETGAAVIQWDVDTLDWKTRSTPKTEDAAVHGKGVGDNAIILMHDIHPSTVAAAPGILRGLQAKGVTIVTISELSLNSGGYQAGRAYCNGTAAATQNGLNCAG